MTDHLDTLSRLASAKLACWRYSPTVAELNDAKQFDSPNTAIAILALIARARLADRLAEALRDCHERLSAIDHRHYSYNGRGPRAQAVIAEWDAAVAGEK